MTRPPDYGRDDVVAALRRLGVQSGDVVFGHTSVAMLGRPECGLAQDAIAQMFLDAFTEVLGPDGTWVIPTYSYSYAEGEVYDPLTTPPTKDMGVLPMALWNHPRAHRSLDPIFSVAAIGAQAEALTAGIPDSCFGPDCFYARLIAADGYVVNIGIGSHSALLHHVEQLEGVPYRYLKSFPGTTVIDGEEHQTEITFNVRDRSYPAHIAEFSKVDRDGRADGSVRATRLGRGEMNLVRAARMAELAREGLARDPDYLVLGDRAVTDS